MIFQYYSETDMLYLKLADGVSTESQEVAPGIVIDFDEQARIVGIEIEDAGTFIDLSRLEVSALPIENLILKKEMPVAANLKRCCASAASRSARAAWLACTASSRGARPQNRARPRAAQIPRRAPL